MGGSKTRRKRSQELSDRSGAVAVAFLDPGEVSFVFHDAMMQMQSYDLANSRRIKHRLREFTAAGGLVANRNKVAQVFLDQAEADWLFMVDADMGFAPDTIDRLIESADPEQRPVVGGLCFALKKESAGVFHGAHFVVVPTLYEFVDTADEYGWRPIIDYPAGVVPVNGTGAACLLVHRSALAAVRDKFGDQWFNQISGNGHTFGEDLSFCIRLTAAGIPIHVDTNVKTTHDKGGVFLDEDEYFRSRLLHATLQKIQQESEVA